MKARNHEMGSNVTSAEKKKGAGQSPSAEDMRSEERSLDTGESGQFAPGAYYKQRVNEPRRSNLDDYIVPPGRDSRRRE